MQYLDLYYFSGVLFFHPYLTLNSQRIFYPHPSTYSLERFGLLFSRFLLGLYSWFNSVVCRSMLSLY